MRELKFRVWDKTENNWFPLSGQSDFVLNTLGHLECFYSCDNKNCIIQQYTGLKDKNGREIFDGDIVKEFFEAEKDSPEYHKYSEVMFIAGGFIANEMQLGLLNDFVEVVGNVFENKDLLK